MAGSNPILQVSCPKSTRQWEAHSRHWSDVPGLYSLVCPGCGQSLRVAVERARIVPLPAWVGRVPTDHGLRLTGSVA